RFHREALQSGVGRSRASDRAARRTFSSWTDQTAPRTHRQQAREIHSRQLGGDASALHQNFSARIQTRAGRDSEPAAIYSRAASFSAGIGGGAAWVKPRDSWSILARPR